jgi:hypothetical protein
MARYPEKSARASLRWSVVRVAWIFPPRVLHPVLDGGVGDEDAVVSPQVPTGRPVGQTVLRNESDRQLLDATGVEAPGECEVGEVGGEVAAAGSAAVP